MRKFVISWCSLTDKKVRFLIVKFRLVSERHSFYVASAAVSFARLTLLLIRRCWEAFWEADLCTSIDDISADLTKLGSIFTSASHRRWVASVPWTNLSSEDVNFSLTQEPQMMTTEIHWVLKGDIQSFCLFVRQQTKWVGSTSSIRKDVRQYRTVTRINHCILTFSSVKSVRIIEIVSRLTMIPSFPSNYLGQLVYECYSQRPPAADDHQIQMKKNASNESENGARLSVEDKIISVMNAPRLRPGRAGHCQTRPDTTGHRWTPSGTTGYGRTRLDTTGHDRTRESYSACIAMTTDLRLAFATITQVGQPMQKLQQVEWSCSHADRQGCHRMDGGGVIEWMGSHWTVNDIRDFVVWWPQRLHWVVTLSRHLAVVPYPTTTEH